MVDSDQFLAKETYFVSPIYGKPPNLHHADPLDDFAFWLRMNSIPTVVHQINGKGSASYDGGFIWRDHTLCQILSATVSRSETFDGNYRRVVRVFHMPVEHSIPDAILETLRIRGYEERNTNDNYVTSISYSFAP